MKLYLGPMNKDCRTRRERAALAQSSQEILTKLILLLNGNSGYGVHHRYDNFQYVLLNRIPAPIPVAAEGIHGTHKRL